jgi:hypothetical protein
MRSLARAALAALSLASCAKPAPEAPASSAPGGWRSFEGTWNAAGDRHAIDTGPDRRAAVVDLSGSVLLTGERGLGAGFQARALAYNDGATSVGRAVWTDERGDRIFSELRGDATAPGQDLVGTITGGTGRWAGITGEYRFDWTWVVETEGRMQGRSVGLRGRARIAAPGEGAR